jgi:hypothetical protein
MTKGALNMNGLDVPYKEEWTFSQIKAACKSFIYEGTNLCAVDPRFDNIIMFEFVEADSKLFYVTAWKYIKGLSEMSEQEIKKEQNIFFGFYLGETK